MSSLVTMSKAQHKRSLVTALLAALFLTSGEGRAQPAVGGAATVGESTVTAARLDDANAVVAHVEGEPLYGRDVALYLRPAPPRIGAARPPDPRMVAAESAIRTVLFAREARRRGQRAHMGSKALAEAALVQGLIREETKRRRVSLVRVQDSEARRFYESHRERLAAVQSVELSAIVTDGPDVAEELLARAEQANEEEFADLVARHSVDEASKQRGGRFAVVDGEGGGTEKVIARVALAMRRTGDVGLARGSDGRHYVLRATRVQLKVPAWDETLAARVRNLVFQEQRERLVEALAAPLRTAAHVEVDAAALSRLRVPTGEEKPACMDDGAAGAAQSRDLLTERN
jgi:PPIC-type PPIASE domain